MGDGFKMNKKTIVEAIISSSLSFLLIITIIFGTITYVQRTGPINKYCQECGYNKFTDMNYRDAFVRGRFSYFDLKCDNNKYIFVEIYDETTCVFNEWKECKYQTETKTNVICEDKRGIGINQIEEVHGDVNQ